ncbi:hypothetical protein LOZ61_001025 [Ophidiomyces ophidiicola]|nr:hypothetical protein LOZ61_001025 [Ophidiomyces ophidiicola]KAI1923807.1 hypothetical protein LOZ60_005020 [Ophidiomyces ophidiicola]KAI1958974.1 hypothetical protein LOZ59_003283 [Ophidiomyces ophidiicola]KAI2022533.1 hypothetical protein LOZ45_004378 [Ophidiomyces ophidiicola]KAI2147170.1 hypothetical protein LOZ27_002778 [Ophidiomyces ophidiicola]
MNSPRPEALLTQHKNPLIFQAFEWNIPADYQHWNRLCDILPFLKKIGVSYMWIPPGCKGMEPGQNGYDIYDLYDIGEFDQKGAIATKWGTKAELQGFVQKASETGIRIVWDAVLNHKAGGDNKETCLAMRTSSSNRLIDCDEEPREIEAWLGFEFPGRGDVYSAMKYHWHHFSGVDYDLKTGTKAIFRITGDNNRSWATDVSKERGNYDYLMFSDVNFSNPDVKEDVKNWIQWLYRQIPIGGLRLDAVKHYSRAFLMEFILHIKDKIDPDWLFFAEYWTDNVYELMGYLERMKNLVMLFDVPLTHNISRISQEDGGDLRRLFNQTLVQHLPDYAVTFITNHDTQAGQSLELPVEPWFKPLAYALVLLRKEGLPCLFYGDLYGTQDSALNAPEPPVPNLALIAFARRLYAYGPQRDYFSKHCVGRFPLPSMSLENQS